MSADLHETCMTWDAHTGKGRARCNGVDVRLTRAPDLGVPLLRTLYFAPAVKVYEIADACNARRDMTPAEIATAFGMLTDMAAAARGQLKTLGL